MPWRRPRKPVERPIDVTRSVEESLQQASQGEEEEDLTELTDLDGAGIAEAATGEPDEERTPSELAAKLSAAVAGAELPAISEAPVTPRARIRRASADADRAAEASAQPAPAPAEAGIDLEVEVARGLRLKNPVMTASGTFGQGTEYAEVIEVARLGAIVNKGTTPRARPGNPQYRIAETPSGILNSIG